MNNYRLALNCILPVQAPATCEHCVKQEKTTQTENCLTFLYSGHEADLPPAVKYLVVSTLEHCYDN